MQPPKQPMMADSPFLQNQAQWIWVPGYDDVAAVGQFALFRKTFALQELPDTSSEIQLHVSADTRYRLYLNGKSISFGPCKSYEARWNYETVNIAPYLVQGQNVLAARVLRFSTSFSGCLSMIRTPFPGLIVYCELPDQPLHTNTSWKSVLDPGTKLVDESEWDFRLGPPFLNLNERVDGRLLYQGWLDASFDDSSWAKAVVKSPVRKMSPMLDPRRLYPREIPALKDIPARFDCVVQTSGPASDGPWKDLISGQTSVAVPLDAVSTVDIEVNALMTGFLDLQCKFEGDTSAAPTIEILCAECYEPPLELGKPRLKGDRTDFRDGELYGHVDRYIPHPGPNSYSPFWFRTYRYLRLTIIPPASCSPETASSLILTSLTHRTTHYPLEIHTTLTTNSSLLTSLWDISLNTLRNCMHETYEDCPFYEQNQFAMDTRSQILFTYVLSRDDRLARKTMREFAASQHPETGLVETHFPSPGRSMSIPSFSLFWVLMVHDHMVHFGDAALVRQYLGAVDGVLGYFDRKIIPELGLVGRFEPDTWPFVDWVDGWATPGKGFTGLAVPKSYYEHGAATFHSLVYAYTLLKASALATFVGRHDTAREYLARQQALVAAVRTHCFDAASGLFLDGPHASPGDLCSQHAQIFAVLAGCVPDAEQRRQLLRRTVLQREELRLAKASFAMGFYLFRAASEADVYEECWPELVKPWEKMIGQKLTTWAESESMVRSDCHGWSATPIYELVTEVLGVRHASGSYVERVNEGKGGGKRQEIEVRVNPRVGLIGDLKGKVVIGDGGETIEVGLNLEGKLELRSDKALDVQVWRDGTWVTEHVG